MLTRDHLHTMIQLIDTVATRGAIRGDELAIVGRLRDELVGVINEIDASQARVDAEPAPELLTEDN